MTVEGPWPGYPAGGGVPPPWAAAPVLPPVRPPAMDRAVLLMRIGAVYSVVTVALGAVLTDVDAAMRTPMFGTQTDSTLAPDLIKDLVYVDLAITVVVSVALWLWMAWANGNGKSWARVVATVFAGIGAASFVLSAAIFAFGIRVSGQSTATLAASLVVATGGQVISWSAIWSMYRPESSEFYRLSSRPRVVVQTYAYGQRNPYGYPAPYVQPYDPGQPPLSGQGPPTPYLPGYGQPSAPTPPATPEQHDPPPGGPPPPASTG